jgi:hypothetical protein
VEIKDFSHIEHSFSVSDHSICWNWSHPETWNTQLKCRLLEDLSTKLNLLLLHSQPIYCFGTTLGEPVHVAVAHISELVVKAWYYRRI